MTESQLLGVLLVLGAQARVGAEKGVLRHVGRVPARRRCAADGLREAADVVRAGAAADAEIADAELERGRAELGQLVAVAREGVESRRERLTVELGVTQRLEGRLFLVRAIRDGEAGDVAAHRRADGLQMREHRARATDAVEADDVGAGGLESLARLGRRQAVTRRRSLVERERYDRGKARLLDDVE